MSCKNKIKPAAFRIKLILLRGVLRRFFLITFHKKYVARRLSERKGECQRCGVCCHLVANTCPGLYFKDNEEYSSCYFYTLYRPPNCCHFPIDERDIADRDLVAPETPCGYSWPHA